MVKKGFPSFGMSQSGVSVADLKNYNLPDFILALIAKECKSELQERGRIDDKLHSMNSEALEMLHKIFVECEEDEAGKFAQYRFYVYVSSMYHKCEIFVDEIIPGASGRNHRIPVAVKSNGMYVAVACNKATGNPVNRREASRFHDIVMDIKNGDHGTLLADATYGSSVGFRKDALEEFEAINKSVPEMAEEKVEFRAVNFENNIYSVIKC